MQGPLEPCVGRVQEPGVTYRIAFPRWYEAIGLGSEIGLPTDAAPRLTLDDPAHLSVTSTSSTRSPSMGEQVMTDKIDSEFRRQQVRAHYGRLATREDESGCCCGSDSCCAGEPSPSLSLREAGRRLGYTDKDLAALPEGVDLGLGCGNPLAIATLRPGETVLDLGSGAGFDCFMAAEKVGPQGHVIGVDMTPEMLTKSRASVGDRPNIEFRLGEIEHLPVANDSVDVVISNCVVNLSPQKEKVFAEVARVLRPGGRLAIADKVRKRSLEGTRWEGETYACQCISGSASVEELDRMLRQAGFVDVRIVLSSESREFIKDWDAGTGVEDYICSALIEAKMPETCCCCA